MIYKVYSVYDSKVESWLQPFFVQNIGAALRAMSDCVSDPGHTFSRHVEDFTLFELGEFDDATGTFTHDSAQSVLKLIELKREQ